jgi:hypothetical protein
MLYYILCGAVFVGLALMLNLHDISRLLRRWRKRWRRKMQARGDE